MNKSYNSMLSFEGEKNDAIEGCLTNIGIYIIQKIREEDLRKDNYYLDIDETTEMKNIYEEVKTKIGISEMILSNRDILINFEDFYEEECQFSLLNWACNIHKRFKELRGSENSLTLNNEKINKDFFNKNSLNNNVEILLFNILNIFETFPIKPEDLKSLNFIEKLKEIKKDMKTQNLIIYKKIKKLIKFWKPIIKYFDNQKANLIYENSKTIINRKRLREDEIIDENNKYLNYDGIKEDNECCSSNLSVYETDSCEHNDTKKKSVCWKDDDILVDKIEYDPNNAPIDH